MFSSPEALKVIKYILTKGQTTQKEISTNTGVSIGYVNEIVQKLREQFIVSKPHARGFLLNDAQKLLIILSQEFPMEKRLYARCLLQGSRREVEERIIEDIVRKQSKIEIGFTLLSALSRYSVAAEGEQVSFYAQPKELKVDNKIDSKNGLQLTNEEVAAYIKAEKNRLEVIDEELTSIEAEKNPMGNISVYIGGQWVWQDVNTVDNVPYVSKIQLIIDLYSYQPLLYIGSKLLNEHINSLPRKEYMKSEMIELSKNELTEFVKFFNEKIGHEPVIIGGWAVDYYNPYYGSKDIDVIFEFDRKAWEQAILAYYLKHDYRLINKEDIFTETFRKEVSIEGVRDYIDIDICASTDKNRFHKNSDKELPYNLLKESRYRNEVKLDNDAIMVVPTIELLLLYKIKAYSDRDYDLRQTFEATRAAYLRSKRDKDGADIIALLKYGVNKQKLCNLIDKFELKNEVREVLYVIASNESSVSIYRRLQRAEVGRLVEEVLASLGK